MFIPLAQTSPEGKALIGSAYDFGPDGATFEPAVALTMSYDAESLPEGVTEDTLQIAYWDGSQWQVLESTVDTDKHTVSTEVGHFTNSAILGEIAVEVDTSTVTPAVFGLRTLTITLAEVAIGETVEISITVLNTGGQSGSYKVTLKIDDEVVETTTVSVAAGKSKEVTFTTSSDTVGTYTVDVNGRTGTFVVVKEASVEAKQISWWIMGVIGTGCIILSLGTCWLVRRKKA